MSATSTEDSSPPAGQGRRREGGWLRDLVQILFFALLVRPFMALFIGLRVRGREHLRVADPFVLVANHSSHLDTLSLLSLFPLRRLRRLRPCAAADYFERNRLVSLLSHTFFNILPIARVDIRPEDHPIRRMREALERGDSLLLFPEGTRGAGGEIGPLRSGVAYLAEQVAGLKVVPAWLENMGRALPKGEFLPVPFFCEVRIGAPLALSGTREEMLESLRLALEDLRGGG
jgi:1-acyl-sn-glycerol-3-phosphate acyltransferase